MAYRKARLSAGYVQSLNAIEMEFFGEKKVIEAWHTMLEHLYTAQPKDAAPSKIWSDKIDELLFTLLSEMAHSLGWHFDRVTLDRYGYYPSGWNAIEMEQTALRQSAIKVFSGAQTIKVEMVGENTASAERSSGPSESQVEVKS